MSSIGRFVAPLAISLAALSSVVFVPSIARAAPGTCKCNNGCHANPGQCLQGNACSVGYEPTCGFRAADGGAPVCPNLSYISCNGNCTCEPVPGYCETIGGAEYCDAGPDTSVPDAPMDTSVTDTATDAPKSDGDACVPLTCPPSTKTLVVAGYCDPYCAMPCGTGEFKCPGALKCIDDFCIPGTTSTSADGGDAGFSSCLLPGAPPCGTCRLCSLGDGTCFDNPACSDGGTDGSPDGADTAEEDTQLVFDTSIGDDTGTGEGTTPTTDDGGCGCSLPGGSSRDDLIALGVAAALLVMLRHRSRG